MKKLSVVIPFFNEEENLRKIYGELKAVRETSLANYEFEILLMDNHSTDRSFQIASEIAGQDSSCKVLRLSRNFGYQANILTGLLKCTGDAAVQLDADGEDDPALIPSFVEKWENGYQVVYGVRLHRVESALASFQRKVFYRILNSLSTVPIPVDAGDFRLIDRQVLEVLKHFREANPYLRGLIAYAGFNQIGVSYKRRKRYSGKSKFLWWDYFSLAWIGITSFSSKPLQFTTWLGFLLSVFSFLAALFYLSLFVLGRVKVAGFTTTILLQLFLTGVQLLSIGLIGKYIAAIFDEVKSRPRSIVETVAGQDTALAKPGVLDPT
jgi:glycosyltransferase involved in cell wall biosynthesis